MKVLPRWECTRSGPGSMNTLGHLVKGVVLLKCALANMWAQYTCESDMEKIMVPPEWAPCHGEGNVLLLGSFGLLCWCEGALTYLNVLCWFQGAHLE